MLLQLPSANDHRSGSSWLSLKHAEIWISYIGDSVCLHNTSSTLFQISSNDGNTITVCPHDAIELPGGVYRLRMGIGLDFIFFCFAGGQQSHLLPEPKNEIGMYLRKETPRLQARERRHSRGPSVKASELAIGWRRVKLPGFDALDASGSIPKHQGPQLQSEIIAITHLSVVVRKTLSAMTVVQKTLKRHLPIEMSNEVSILRKLDHVRNPHLLIPRHTVLTQRSLM